MTRKKSNAPALSDIRRYAEERVGQMNGASLSKVDIEKLVDELKVHQAELEIQNEELVNAMTAMEELRDRYVTLYDFAPVGYFNMNEKGIIAEANLAGAGLLGANRQDLIGRPLSRYILPDSQEAFYLYVKKVMQSGEKEVCELELKKENGAGFTAILEGSAIGQEGSIGFRVAVIDISDRKKTEDALRVQTSQLEEANKNIEAFAYSVSHDLRAPIRAMDGFTTMILKEHGSSMEGELRRKFGVVLENTKLMSSLIDALLDFSRLSRREISRSEVDMKENFESVWGELKAQHSGRDIEFILGGMPSVFGDRALLRQVVYNLLANAIKFTDRKDGKAVIKTGGYRKGEDVVFFVSDNGAGFDMKYYDKLFGVFQRLHSAKEFEGTGIGLAIVQNVIHRHGGKVWAEGETGKGATFYFSLPRERE